MIDKIMIDDYKNTIARLQQECTEKTNNIIALGEQLKRKEEIINQLEKNKGWSKEYDELKSQLQAEKQKVEKLEEELTLAKKDMCQKCDFQKLYFDNTKKLMKEKQKYKQALEEIKGIGTGCLQSDINGILTLGKQILQKCKVLENEYKKY